VFEVLEQCPHCLGIGTLYLYTSHDIVGPDVPRSYASGADT
jgi:hypothetical protein